MRNIKGMICIQNFGPSGSLYLHGLLDGHPQLLTLPALYSRELYRFWEETTFYSAEDLTNQFCESPYNKYWFVYDPVKYAAIPGQGLEILGDNMDEHIVADETRFRKFMSEYLNSLASITRKEFIKSVYFAWYNQFPSEKEQDVWLLFAFHSNPDKYIKQIIEDFEYIKFLYIVRDPMKSLESGQKFAFLFNERHPCFTGWYDMRGGHSSLATTMLSESVQQAAIRLEDVHSAKETTMKNIASWLGIKFLPLMLESNFEGKKWWNRKISLKRNHVEFNFINAFDRYRLSFISRLWRDTWEYDIPPYNYTMPRPLLLLLMLVPFKLELYHRHCFKNFKNIFANRICNFIFKITGYQRWIHSSVSKLTGLFSPLVFIYYAIDTLVMFIANYVSLRKYYFTALELQNDDYKDYVVPLLKNINV